MPSVSNVRPHTADVVASWLTVESEGNRWKIAPKVFDFSSRSNNKYITLAMNTIKNAAYAKISSVV